MIKNKKIFIKKFIICIGFFLSFFLSIFGLTAKADGLPANNVYGGVIWQENLTSAIGDSSDDISGSYYFEGSFMTYDYEMQGGSFGGLTKSFNKIQIDVAFPERTIQNITYYQGSSIALRLVENNNFNVEYCPFFWNVGELNAVNVLTNLQDFFSAFTYSGVGTTQTGLTYYPVGFVFGLSSGSDTEMIAQLQAQITQLTSDNENLQSQIAHLNSLISQQNILITSLKNQLNASSKDIYAWNTISFAILIPDGSSSSGYSYYFGDFNEFGSKQEKDLFTLDVHKFFTTKEIAFPTTAFGDGDYFKVHFYSSVPYNAMKYPIYYYPDDETQYLSIYNLPSGVGTTDKWNAYSPISKFTFKEPLTTNFLIFNQNYEWNGLEIGISSLESGYNIKLTIGNLYSQGFDNGYIAGQNASNGTINSLNNKITQLEISNSILQNRIDDLSKDKISFMSLFMGISNIPSNIMSSMLNFDVLGINLLGLVTGLLSALLLIWLIKKFI